VNWLERIELLLWRARHPSVRRCPSCRTTWERLQEGICHDCRDGSGEIDETLTHLAPLEALAEFAQHDSWRCAHPDRFPWEPDCQCGLTAAQRAAGVPVDVPVGGGER